MFPRKTSWTLAGLIALLALLPRLPGLAKFPGITTQPFTQLATFAATVKPTVAPVVPPSAPKAPAVAKTRPPTPFFDIPPHSMDHFFAALQRTKRKEPGAVTRILHYGDSPTTADLITADVRSQLQKQFGDAGHGFYLIAPPWAWYGHRDMKVSAKGWKVEAASLSRAKDGVHGLGGVSFRGLADSYSTVKFPAGHTHVTLYYWKEQEGGSVQIKAGDQTVLDLQTGGGEGEPGFADFEIPAESKELELRVLSGKVRLFGYRFDKPGPGIEYSSLGVNGAQVQMVVRFFEVKQWTAALQHENPDLVIVNYGTNESLYPGYLDKQYPDELRTVIARIRAAVPEASVLMMSPMDRGQTSASGEISTPPALIHLIEVQKKIAAETGCAFFNTFKAMGGEGTMGQWYKAQPRLVSADFMHPLPAGAAKVGTLFEQALVKAAEEAR